MSAQQMETGRGGPVMGSQADPVACSRSPLDAEVALQARGLIRALQQDLALGRRLVDLAHSMTSALTGREPSRVREIEAETRSVSERQGAAESERNAAARALASVVGAHGQSPTITQIASRLPAAESRRLLDLRAAVLSTHQQIQAANDRNRALVESANGYVQFSLKLLLEAAMRPPTYGPARAVVPTFYVDQKC